MFSQLRKRSLRWGLLLGLSSLVWVYLACGASRQTTKEGEDVDLDELLGEEKVTASNLASEEAEVLRLLGIKPEEDSGKKAVFASQVEQSEAGALESQLSQLQEELSRKEQEIAQLRQQLTQKESRISDLEMQARRTPRPAPAVSRKGEPSLQFKQRYQQALGLFKAYDYQGALRIFQELLQAEPNTHLSDNCQYWIGECYYGMKQFNQAIVEFEKVFSFTNSNKADDAQLKLGLCYLKLGDRQQARAEFERLLSNFSDSEYVPLAERYLARL